MNLNFVFGIDLRYILGIVGNARVFVLIHIVQAKRQCHIAMFVMVPVRFAIGGDVNELGFIGLAIERI